MNRSDLTDDVLAARIRSACEDRGEALAVEDRPFDPGAAAPAGLPLAPSEGRRPRILLAAAAVVVVGALVAAAVLTGGDDGTDDVRAGTTTSTAPVAAGGWLAPSSAPLGLELKSVVWSAKPPTAGFSLRTQLFQTADGEGLVYVAIQPGTGDLLGDPGPVVQGHETGVMSSKEGDGVTLTWHDGDTSIDAQWQGIDEVGAVALLDQLRWRTADPMDGFEVTPGGTASIVDEGDPAQVTHQVELVYAPKPGTEVDGVEELRIITGAGDGSSWDTVLSEFFGSFTDGRNSAEHQTDPDLRQLEVASPGRLVRIDAGSSAVTDAQLQAIADSLVPTDEAGLRALERRTPGAELANDPPPTSSTTSAPYDPTLAASPAPLSVPLEQADGSGSATLAELADGRPLAVVLWQTYCVPCIQYLQALDEEAAAHPDRAVVAVATQDTAEQVGTFVRESGLDLPVLLDPEGAILDGWNVSVVPYTVFTNEQGQVETGAPGALSDNDEGQYFLDEFFNG